MHFRFASDGRFWKWFVATGCITGLFFAWELGFLSSTIPSLPRPEPTIGELAFTAILTIFLALDTSLLRWRSIHGSCPVGVKRATKIGGAIGAIALLCPVCLVIPVSFLGLSVSVAFLSPFLPLLRAVVIVLLGITTVMVWPKDTEQRAN